MPGLLKPAIVDQSAKHPGGVLAKSLPAPAGWERGGLVIPFYGCSEPVLRDKCVAGTDVPDRTRTGEFPAWPLEHAAGCSTTNPDGMLLGAAQDRYAATAEWAAGRQLHSDPAGTGAPTLQDGDTLGVVADADFTTAVACLEQAAADLGFGEAWVLHAPVGAAAYLAASQLNVGGTSPAGAPWIVSPGYPRQGATTIRLWLTGRVWASVSAPTVKDAVAHRVNNEEAWAIGEGVVAFDPCLNLYIDVTVPACPTV